MITARDAMVAMGWPVASASDVVVRRAIADFQSLCTWPGVDGEDLKVDGLLGRNTTHAIAQALSNGNRISPNFKTTEFRCHCTPTWIDGDRDVVRFLEAVRSVKGKPVSLVSAHRTDHHNATVGGSSGSFHTCKPPRAKSEPTDPGCHTSAVDIPTSVGLTYYEARTVMGWKGGLGRRDDNNVVVHIDNGPQRQWWYSARTGRAY